MRKIIISLMLISTLFAGATRLPDYDKVTTDSECKYILESSKRYADKSISEFDLTLKLKYIDLANQYLDQHTNCMSGDVQRQFGDKLLF